MKKLILSLILLLAVAMGASAQKTVVTGVLVDSTLNEAEPYATVRIYKSGKPQKPVAMLLTDVEGRFRYEVAGRGDYVVHMSSVGKQDVVRRITLGSQQQIDLGTVLMSENATMLKGVEIVAQRPIVKMEADKMTYNVQEDADSRAATVLDMLRKVPMVTVDGQDNITVNGSSSFKVYADGKPNPMMSASPSQVFKAMPASMVKSIEVVTNPGAKYDAEGAAGVLNIIMNKEAGGSAAMNGYNGNVRLSAGTNSYGASAFVSGQQGRLSYSANATYHHAHPGATDVTIERRQQGAADATMLSVSSTKPKIPFTMGNITLGYELDSMSTLNLTAGITSFNMKNNGLSRTTLGGSLYGQNSFGYDNNLVINQRRTSFNGSLDYQRYLNRQRTSSLALTYQLNHAPSKNEQQSDFEASQPLPIDLTDRYSLNRETTTEHIMQADLTLPIGKGQTLNTGAKLALRKASSDASYYLEQVYTPSLSSDYDHHNTILAGYAEYEAKSGKWSGKGGLRYEQTWQRVEYHLGNGTDFSKHYGNLVPSASLSYSLTQRQNIGLTYNLRISRPGISYLNPYVDRSNPTALEYGNTDLGVEKSHNIGLVYNQFTQKLTLSVNLRHTLTTGGIEQYSFYDSENLLNTTYGNVVRRNQTSLNVYANWLLHKNTRLFLNGGADYSDLRSTALDTRNSGWHANLMAGVQQTLPADVKLGAYLITSTRSHTLQGWNGGFNMLTANISKSFFHDKLNVSLMGMTGLSSGGKLLIESYSSGRDFTNHMQVKVPMSNVSLSVTYNFGNTKKQFRQHQSRVESDYIEQRSDGEVISGAQMGQQ